VSPPPAVTPLCRLDEIAEGEGRGFVIGEGADQLAVFVVRAAGRAYGYLNACPHLGTPLDWGGFEDDGRFVSADSGNILCATHGAEFRIEDGYCLAGPCAGTSLQPVEIDLDGDGIVHFRGLGAPPAWL
jgi:naringenin degradation protein FdeD